MAVEYTKIDIFPLFAVEWPFPVEQWFSLLVDIINQDLLDLEAQWNNGIEFPHKTTAEITALATDPNNPAPNGTGWYCTDSSPPNIVFKINGSLVQLNTSPFP